MKKYITLTLITTLCVFLTACIEKTTTQSVSAIKGISQENVIVGFKDNFDIIKGASFSDDGKKLIISDNVKGEYFILRARTKEGLLKPETDYIITCNVKVSASEVGKNYLHIIVRDTGVSHHMGDLFRTNKYSYDKNGNVRMKFRTPKDPTNYTVQFISRGTISAEVSDFKVDIGSGEDFYPAQENAPRYVGDLGKLPTGCPNFEIEQPKPTKEIIVNATDFGLNESVENCADIINKAIEHCKKIGASKLVLPKGNYKIYQSKGINFVDMTDFTFDGNGSTLIYRKDKGSCNMYIRNCLRTKFKNFNMDWDWDTEPLASIVELIDTKESTKAGESYFDFKFVDFKKHPLYNKPIRVVNLSCYDPILKVVGIEGGKGIGFYKLGPDEPRPKTQWISPNVLRVYSHRLGHVTAYQKGTFYRMQHYYYGICGIVMESNKHQTFENINIYSCKGHGLLCSGEQQYFSLDNVNIVAPKNPKQPRPITTTADHFHFSRSKGYYKMSDCEFSLGADDCINIHDSSGFGIRHDDHTILINSKRYAGCNAGDLVELRHSDYSKTNYKSKVKSVYVKNGVRYLQFEDKLPEQTTDGFVIFNLRYHSANISIKNCYFHSNRARGLLILTNNVTIENCKFYHNEMGALKFETGYTMDIWCEGYGVDNVVVRNCYFDSVNPLESKHQGKVRDIFMGVYLAKDPSDKQTKYPIISNILFENNKFKDSFGLVAFIASSGNVIFKDNTFINTTPRKKPLDYRGAFYVTSSTNTKIVNNVYVNSPYVKNAGVYVDSETGSVDNIVIAGNKITNP